MFLSNTEINEHVQEGKLLIQPFDQTLLRPASYVLRLSNLFRRFKSKESVDVLNGETIKRNVDDVVRQDSFVLQPYEFILASTVEKVGIPNDLLGLLSGLSHLGRIGLVVHSTSVLINPGFGWQTPSNITLELFSYNPSHIKLYSGMPLSHLLFAKLSGQPSEGYNHLSSLYTGQEEPQPSRYYDEFKRYMQDIDNQ